MSVTQNFLFDVLQKGQPSQFTRTIQALGLRLVDFDQIHVRASVDRAAAILSPRRIAVENNVVSVTAHRCPRIRPISPALLRPRVRQRKAVNQACVIVRVNPYCDDFVRVRVPVAARWR